MKTAVYTNKVTNETYKLAGVKNLEHAWKMNKFVCGRNNWNQATFAMDVTVKIEK